MKKREADVETVILRRMNTNRTQNTEYEIGSCFTESLNFSLTEFKINHFTRFCERRVNP